MVARCGREVFFNEREEFLHNADEVMPFSDLS